MEKDTKAKQKNFIIYPDYGVISVIIICCILSCFLIAQRYQGGTSISTPDPRLLHIIGVVLFIVKSKTIKVTQDQVCVIYCWIIKRRISCERICSIELKSGSLFFLLDNHKRLSQSDNRIKQWMPYFDPKVISVSIPEKKWDETAQKITALFPKIVTVERKTGDSSLS